ncbi:MAG TPA: substrate-binding domain-containing protein [Terriglobales bacterium]|nr:substrate-binding domain-containing protein [Terriglobales bacterium]
MTIRSQGSNLLLVLVLIFAWAGCASQHSADENYYLVTTNKQIPYWQAAGAGFLHAAAQMKVKAEFVGPDTYDPKAEQLEFEKLLQSKPTGILVSPASGQLMRADIDQAIAAGIPVITIDSDAPESKRLFFIGTNNYQAGVMGAKVAAAQLRGKGNVVIFTMPGQTNLDDRLRGYRDIFASYSGLKIVRLVDIHGDPRVAFDTTEQIIGQKKEKVDGFVCLEALAGKEVGEVLDRYHVTGKTVVAMDTDPDTLDWIKKGVIAATVAQKPYTMSLVGLEMLDDLYHHKLRSLQQNWAQDPFSPLPAFVDTGATLIDKSNVDAFISAQKSATAK